MDQKRHFAIIAGIIVIVVLGATIFWHHEASAPQTPGTSSNSNSTSSDSTDLGVNCNESDNYIAISKNSADGVGSDILIKHKISPSQSIPCVYTSSTGDLEIKNVSAEYFLGFAGNFLVLDSGTGPPPRGMIIYDLTTQKNIYSGSYSGPVTFASDTVTFWKPTKQTPTTANCPQLSEWTADGLGAAIESHISLALPSLAVKNLGESQCVPMQ